MLSKYREMMVFFAFFSLFLSAPVFSDEALTISAPDVIDGTKFFDIEVVVNDEDVRKNSDTVTVSNCRVASGSLASFPDDIGYQADYSRRYSGQERFSLSLAAFVPEMLFDDGYDELFKTTCILYIGKDTGTDYIEVDAEAYSSFSFLISNVDADIDIPSGLEPYDEDILLTTYFGEPSYDITLMLDSYESYGDEPAFDLDDPDYEEHYARYHRDYNMIDLELQRDGDDVLYKFGYSYDVSDRYYDSLSADEKKKLKTNLKTELQLAKYYPTFAVQQEYSKEREVLFEEIELEAEKDKEEFLNIADSLSIRSSGNNQPTYDYSHPEEELTNECYTDEDCKSGYICSACGICERSENLYSENELVIAEASINPDYTSKTIYNKITSRIIIRMYPKIVFENSDGEEIDACSMKKGAFSGLKLTAEIDQSDRYAGFTTGMLLDERKGEDDWEYKLGDDEQNYLFVISPNDREKQVGLVSEISESATIKLENERTVIAEEEFDYTLLPVDMDIELETKAKNMQQDSSKAIYLTVKNPTAKYIISRIRAVSVGGIELDDDTFKHTEDDDIYTNKLIITDLKPNKKYGIAYYAPELGNINIGRELQSLSMWDLQKQAHKAALLDTAMAYGGEAISNGAKKWKNIADSDKTSLEGYRKLVKKNPAKYSAKAMEEFSTNAHRASQYQKNWEDAAKIVDAENKIYGAIQTTNSASSTKDDIDDMSSESKATLTEKAAMLGVTTIDALQTGVGAVSLVTNKIPVVGKMTAGVQSAFSWATNVWKANFQYIANSEKIERSQEKTVPVIIMVEVSDESGWITNSAISFGVIYHHLE